jgi:hypothetical protein
MGFPDKIERTVQIDRPLERDSGRTCVELTPTPNDSGTGATVVETGRARPPPLTQGRTVVAVVYPVGVWLARPWSDLDG